MSVCVVSREEFNREKEECYQKIKDRLAHFPNFPKKGVNFIDMRNILVKGNDGLKWRDVMGVIAFDLMETFRGEQKFDTMAALESRGFIFASGLACHTNSDIVLFRKPGKTPDCEFVEYGTEYSKDRIEAPRGSLKGKKVLIVDDVLATGGTALAACKLVNKCGGTVAGIFCLIELVDLPGRQKLLDYGICNEHIFCPIKVENYNITTFEKLNVGANPFYRALLSYKPEDFLQYPRSPIADRIAELYPDSFKYKNTSAICFPSTEAMEKYKARKLENLNVLVATKSNVKAYGVKLFFDFLQFHGQEYNLIINCMNTDSGIHEQPIGEEETKLGVENRLNQIKRIKGYDVYISIENGILRKDEAELVNGSGEMNKTGDSDELNVNQINNQDLTRGFNEGSAHLNRDTGEMTDHVINEKTAYLDYCYSAVHLAKSGETFYGKSYPVPVDGVLGQEFTPDKTFGQCMSEVNPQKWPWTVPKDDWYACFGYRSRSEMVADSLMNNNCQIKKLEISDKQMKEFLEVVEKSKE